MELNEDQRAWNRMVFNCHQLAVLPQSDRHHAVGCAGAFMCISGNGGIYGFLESCAELDPRDVVGSLQAIGAAKAASQLSFVLEGLGGELADFSPDIREQMLLDRWPESWGNDEETVTAEAERELTQCLEREVSADREFYLSLAEPSWPSD
ncbi:hypothetical protein BH09PSE4_BH09PSE4_03650 [soil metagenome]